MLNFIGDLCGYIYITTTKSYIYDCKFCENQFESSKEFQDHNISEHLEKNVNERQVDNDLKDITNLSSNSVFSTNKFKSCSVQDNIKLEEDGNLQMEEKLDSNDSIVLSENIEHSHDEKLSETEDNIQTAKVHDDILIDALVATNCNSNEVEILSCRFCSKTFNKKTHLIEHTKNHLNYSLTCKICGKHTKQKKDLQRHQKTHLKIKCSICEISCLPDQFEKHLKRHEMLRCKYCSKICKNPYAIQNHLRTHTGEKPYKCDVCFAAFADKSNLQSHMFTQHTGDEKNFTCKFCNRKFKTKQLHDQHNKRVHLKEKPHVCEFCGFNFSSSSGLRRHKLKHHTDYHERPHHCKMCDKKFVELKNLTEHMNTHTGEKPFLCEICLKGFGQQKTLREHKKLHTGQKKHVCKICGKAFAQHSGCANHMKQHHMLSNISA